MTEQAAVVEQPKPVVEEPKPTEEQITESYIEARKEGKTADLPFAPPTIPEIIPQVAPTEPPPPTPEVAEIIKTDSYLEERKVERERKRGGKQRRIDELTKEKAELAAKTVELEAKVAEKPPVVEEVKPVVEEKPPEVAKVVEIPKKQPRINEFENIDDYNAALALWAADERAKLAPVEKKLEEPQPVLQVRKEEFDTFLEKGKSFMATHPDFNQRLQEATIRGLTISEQARAAITKLAVPEVVYWLADPTNDLAARKLMTMDEGMQAIEIGRIAERLSVSPADFVSNAPQPGTRLTGGRAVAELPLSQITDTDEYIRQRRLQKRQGRSR